MVSIFLDLVLRLKSKITELESRPPIQDAKETSGIKQEDLDAALVAKDKEHQSALEAAKENLRTELQAEFVAIQQSIDANSEASPDANKEKERLKAVITRNVEHRIGKEKERWLQETESTREALVDEKVQATLKDKLSELEIKMQKKEAELKAEVERAKDAIRQEGVMRSKVQINMLERKNKMLEDKLKAATDGSSQTTAQAATPTQTPTQQLPTGIRRPSQIGTTAQQVARPQTPPTPAQIHAVQQAVITAAEQAAPNVPPHQQRRTNENQGTAPNAIRQLRGALSGSSIPRGGAMAARGGRPQSQAGNGLPVLCRFTVPLVSYVPSSSCLYSSLPAICSLTPLEVGQQEYTRVINCPFRLVTQISQYLYFREPPDAKTPISFPSPQSRTLHLQKIHFSANPTPQQNDHDSNG